MQIAQDFIQPGNSTPMNRKAAARRRKADKITSETEGGGGEVQVQDFLLNSAVRNTLLAQQFKQLIYILSFALISFSLYHAYEEGYHEHVYTRYLTISSTVVASLVAWCVRAPETRGREFRIAGLLTASQFFVSAYLTVIMKLQVEACLPLGGFLYALVWSMWKTIMKNAMKIDSAQLRYRMSQQKGYENNK